MRRHNKGLVLSADDQPWGNHSATTFKTAPATVEEALTEAGLNWEVALSPGTTTWEGKVIPMSHRAVIRTSDGRKLGEVGPGYRPLQNVKVFSFLDEALKKGIIRIETAGQLRHGGKVWMLARVIGTEVDVVTGDNVCGYFLIANSHDGTFSMRLGFLPIRIQCSNALQSAISNDLLRVRHTENAEAALEEIQDIIDWKRREFAATADQMRSLARKQVSAAQIREYVRRVFEPEIKKETVVDEDLEARLEKLTTAKILPLFEKGRGNNLPKVKGTAWAMYNAVTEHMTWQNGRSADTRLNKLWWGESNRVNMRAFTEALKVAA